MDRMGTLWSAESSETGSQGGNQRPKSGGRNQGAETRVSASGSAISASAIASATLIGSCRRDGAGSMSRGPTIRVSGFLRLDSSVDSSDSSPIPACYQADRVRVGPLGSKIMVANRDPTRKLRDEEVKRAWEQVQEGRSGGLQQERRGIRIPFGSENVPSGDRALLLVLKIPRKSTFDD